MTPTQTVLIIALILVILGTLAAITDCLPFMPEDPTYPDNYRKD